MKRKSLMISILIMVLLFSSFSSYGRELRVYDFGGLLTADESDLLESDMEKISESLDLDIIIVTILDADGKTSRNYADDFYDSNPFGPYAEEKYRSGVLLLIDMDNRETYISTDTDTELRFTDWEVERMQDSIYDRISEGDYYGSCQAFLKGVEKYGSFTSESGIEHKEESLTQKLLKNLLISLGTGGVILLIMVISSKARFAVGRKTYQSDKGVNIRRQADHFIRTTTHTRRIPRNTSSGSGSSGSGRTTTHTSSSGRSHGGGGRKF